MDDISFKVVSSLVNVRMNATLKTCEEFPPNVIGWKHAEDDEQQPIEIFENNQLQQLFTGLGEFGV